VAQGVVVVHTVDGSLFGLNAESGAQLWRYDRKIPILTLRGSSAPKINGDSVVCGLAGGKLISLNLVTGNVEWERNVSIPRGGSELERLTDIDANPLIQNETIFVASYQGDVAAVGGANGQIFWNRDLSSYNNLAANWEQLYVSDSSSFVWALDSTTGAAKWRQKDLANRRLSAPAIVGDYLVVGDYEGYLHWLSQADGAIIARSRLSSAPISASPLVVEDTLYVQGDKGDLAAISIASGN
jgi:outer membrane protein assembly factor BamB